MTSYFGFEKDGKMSSVLFRTVKRPKEPRKRISKKSLKWIHDHLNEFAWGLLVPTPQQRRKNESAIEKLGVLVLALSRRYSNSWEWQRSQD